MIPLLGVPVLNREDLAARMVASVDHPVDELLVVVNADDKGPTMTAISTAAKANPNIRKVSYSLPSFNLGCGGSWNHIIRHCPAGPWWLIVNADIVFGPGDLARLEHAMEPEAAHLATVFEFGAFALNTGCVDAVGWFDENFHPMYYEDKDYEHRMRQAGVPYVKLESGATHDTSSTIRSSPRLSARNDETFGRNGRYYLDKWGGPPYQERFTAPFNGERPVVTDRGRLARQAW